MSEDEIQIDTLPQQFWETLVESIKQIPSEAEDSDDDWESEGDDGWDDF